MDDDEMGAEINCNFGVVGAGNRSKVYTSLVSADCMGIPSHVYAEGEFGKLRGRGSQRPNLKFRLCAPQVVVVREMQSGFSERIFIITMSGATARV